MKDCAVRRASMCILRLVHHTVARRCAFAVLYIFDMQAIAMDADACNAWASRSGGRAAYGACNLSVLAVAYTVILGTVAHV